MFTVEAGGGFDVVLDELRVLETLGVNMRSLMARLAAQQVTNIKERVNIRRGKSDGMYSASKRAMRDSGQTLQDRGHMINSLRAYGVTNNEAHVGFGSALEGKKALWAQEGTRAHRVEPKVKKALRFKVAPGRGKKSFAFSKGHDVPGTPPRPFFGVSPRDEAKLREVVSRWLSETRKRGR